MIPMDAILTTVLPHTDAMLAVGSGAIGAAAMFLTLALALAFGVGRELRTAAGARPASDRPHAFPASRLAA
jgi:hypothetical protein